MAQNSATPDEPVNREWFILSRWEEYSGEGRANLLRILGITLFYAVELINYYGVNVGFLQMPALVDRPFHIAVTLLTVAWTMVCLGVLYCRRLGIFPASLKFISTGADLVLLTCILALADGPRSPLVVGYFLIIAASSLRFSLRLIWFSTAGAAAGYLFLLGFARWGHIPDWPRGDLTVPRYHQAIVLLGLILCGVILGQVIRRVRRLSEQYCSIRPKQEVDR